MEQEMRRKTFILTHFINMLTNMVLNKTILKQLYADPRNPCKHLNPILQHLESMEAKKCFILLEYTKDREPIEYLAKLFELDEQHQISHDLREYNSSEQFINYVTDEFLEVRKANVLRSNTSRHFIMETKPRGVCLILCNIIELLPQAIQMAYVFKQLYFNVIMKKMKTKQQIYDLFRDLAQNPKHKDCNALVTIAFGHGNNGLFCGTDVEQMHPINGYIPITGLIDLFAENKLNNFNQKPKIHVFDCCRVKTNVTIKVDGQFTTLQNEINNFNNNWVNNNVNTYIVYSCAEGQKGFYSSQTGFTFYGRALSHTLAQFACEQHLQELLTTINKRLDKDQEFEAIKQYPENIHHYTKRDLYFNPGRERYNQ